MYKTTDCKIPAHSLFSLFLAAAPRRSVLLNDLLSYRAASTVVLLWVLDVMEMCICVECGGVIVNLKGVACGFLLIVDHESARDGWGVGR